MANKLNKLMDLVLVHEHGGNGFVIVQDLGDEYVRVVSVGAKTLGGQAFLAWLGKLSEDKRREDPAKPDSPFVNIPIPDHLRSELAELRTALANGTKVVKDTRMVTPPPTQSE